eukprot:GHRQ01030042.1.p1 GENE.GHRQ01030042.1~~GHRQ01030042.1.p1  ORF type:complete len:113 (-),score=18.19 GHRQ01030042.1:406-744(-)
MPRHCGIFCMLPALLAHSIPLCGICCHVRCAVHHAGCVLYELASLQRAFDGGSLPALVVKILRGRYPPLPGRYSPQLRGLVDALLQQDPQVHRRTTEAPYQHILCVRSLIKC